MRGSAFCVCFVLDVYVAMYVCELKPGLSEPCLYVVYEEDEEPDWSGGFVSISGPFYFSAKILVQFLQWPLEARRSLTPFNVNVVDVV